MTITPAQYSKAQRRLLATLGGFGVAALAAGTFVLSYDDLRLLALRGGAAQRWAFLYPGMLDGLVVVIILAILGARRSNWFSRALRWLLLLILIAGAGAAGIQRAVKGYAALPDTWVNVGVAVAPWAILILAVWLWVAMFRHVRSLRSPRSRRSDGALSGPGGPDGADGSPGPAGAGVETVPATVVDKSIIPGLENETRPLPRPASIRELEPVRAAAPQPEKNPWEAARLAPDPTEEDTEPVPVSAGRRAAWDEVAAGEAETGRDRPVNRSWQDQAPAGHAEPSDPVPPSWHENETHENATDDIAGATTEESAGRPSPDEEPEHADPAAPAPTGARTSDEVSGSRPRPEPSDPVPPSWGAAEPGTSETADETAASDRPGDSAGEEPRPLLPPTPRRTEPPSGKPAGRAEPPAADATEPDSQVEAPVNDKPAQPAGEDPRPRLVARTSLPTDVRLVGPKQRPSLTDTQPDGIKLPDTNPDGIPIVGPVQDLDDEDDAYADERAEDPDAGMESTPPSSKFRSSPTPPRG